ncbi:MAG: RNA polymerase sigma factor [Gammaproteobacteria bacterium]|nr:RNA polymerase sigma factor [Gammaproteobacteria bacterium]
MSAVELNRFLMSVERRAFRMAQIAVRDVDEAMDIVQDTMMTLARKYGNKPESEWKPLFYRILQNRITDSHRRSTVKKRIFSIFRPSGDEEGLDPIESAPGMYADEPDFRLEMARTTERLEAAIAELPRRQQQAFLLRTYDGMDVRDTARAMKCSQGSVKTHFSRAVHKLREVLEDNES